MLTTCCGFREVGSVDDETAVHKIDWMRPAASLLLLCFANMLRAAALSGDVRRRP